MSQNVKYFVWDLVRLIASSVLRNTGRYLFIMQYQEEDIWLNSDCIQHKDTTHTVNVIRDYLQSGKKEIEQEVLEVMIWPPQSPDPNTTESNWLHEETKNLRQITSRLPKIQDLWLVLQDEKPSCTQNPWAFVCLLHYPCSLYDLVAVTIVHQQKQSLKLKGKQAN